MIIGFTPARLPGLAAWWRADKIIKNGTDVLSALDLSGNNRSLVQSTPAKQPALNVADHDFNGHNSIEFDGSDDLLTNVDIASIVTGADKPFTVILVMRRISNVSGKTIWIFGNSGDVQPFHSAQVFGGGLESKISVRDDIGTSKSHQISSPDMPNRVDPAFVMSWASSGTETLVTWNNTEQGGSGQDLDVGTRTLNLFTLGANKTTSETGHTAFKFAECLIFDRQLTTSEQSDIYNYLNDRYLSNWQPTDLTGMEGWYKFDPSYVTLNGSTVSQVEDLSGNSNVMVQGTASNQPLHNEANINFKGRGTIEFVDSDWMTANTLSSHFNGEDKPFTIVMIASNKSYGTRHWWSVGEIANAKSTYGGTDSLNKSFLIRDSTTLKTVTSDIVFPDVKAIVVSWSDAGTSGKIRWGEVDRVTGDTDIETILSDSFYIGDHHFIGSVSASYVLAEMIVYNRQLSDAELDSIDTYARERYGISDNTNLPVIGTAYIQNLNAERGVTLDGVTSRVETWLTQEGSGTDATQTVDANQPAFTGFEVDFNNHSLISGDAAAYYMRMDGLATSHLTGDDVPFYICFAGRFVTNGADPVIFSMNKAADATHYHSLENSGVSFKGLREAGDTLTTVTGTNVTPDAYFHIFEYIFTGTTLTIRIDGVDAITVGAQNNAAITLTTSSLFAFLASGTTPSNYSDLQIANWAVCEAVPTEHDQSIVRNFMQDTYGFKPSSISGLAAWWRSDNVIMNGADVSEVEDLSGNSRPLIQATPANQPALNVDDVDFGGHNSIEFDGSTELLTADDLASIVTGEDKPFTIILCMRRNDDTDTKALWAFGNSGTDVRVISTETRNTGADAFYVRGDDAAVSKNFTTTNNLPTSSDSSFVISWADSGTETLMYWNNIERGGSGEDLDVGTITLDQFAMGALRGATVIRHMAYKFVEAMVYNRQLTASELSKIHNYAVKRYDLWTPTSLAGLSGWWRSDNVTLNGSDVSDMADLSGNNRPLIQATPANQPTLNIDDPDFGGHDSIEFNGTNNFMTADAIGTDVFAGDDSPYTIIFVMRRMTAVTNDYLWSAGATNNTAVRAARIVDTVNNLAHWHSDNVPTSKTFSVTPSFPLITNPPIVISWAFDGTECVVTWDNIEKPVSMTDISLGDSTCTQFTLAALRWSSAINHMAYKFSECLVFDRQITTAEQSEIYDYLTKRYKL